MGPAPGDSAESRARQKVRALWQTGDLFHACTRYPRKRGVPRIDRLAGILQRGLVAPASCPHGLVRPDLNLMVTGCSVPYDSLVFLHRFGPQSYLYTLCEPDRFAVFVEPAFPVLTEEDMGADWPVLCLDEVYVRDRVPTEKLIGVAIYPGDAESVLREFLAEFKRLEIPLYDYEANVLWPPAPGRHRGVTSGGRS